MAIRNHLGKIMLSAWKKVFNAGSTEEVEALACREGLLLAAEWTSEPIEASPHKRELKCDTKISPRRLMPHLLHQMVHYHTNLRGGHSIQMIINSNQATT